MLVGACTGGGDGATTTSNTRVLTLPAGCQPGDVCVVETTININGSTATAPGFSVVSGPDSPLSGHVNWMLTKTLTSSDISSGSFTVTWSSSGRTLAVGTVRSGVTGTPQVAYSGASSTTSLVAPTVTTTADSSDVFTLAFSRIGSGKPVSASYPAGWTQGVQTATNMNSGVNWGGSTATKDVVGASGNYGGELISFAGTATSASAYTVAFAPVPVDVPPSEGSTSGAFGWSGTVDGKTSPSGTTSGSMSWAGNVVGATVPAGSTAGEFGWSGAATGLAAPKGTSNGGFTWSGAASGKLVAQASTTGSFGWSGSSTGKTTPNGLVNGNFSWSGSVSGASPGQNTVSGQFHWSGSVGGSTASRGSVSGAFSWSTSAITGRTQPLGASGGSFGWAGSVVGSSEANPPPPDFTQLPTAFITPNQSNAFITRVDTKTAITVNATKATITENKHTASWRYPEMSQWKTGDTWPPLEVTLKKGDGTPVDLTNASSVAFHSRGPGDDPTVINKPMDTVNATGGVVQYQWQTGDLNQAGLFTDEVEVTWSDGKVQTFPAAGNFTHTVVEQIA